MISQIWKQLQSSEFSTQKQIRVVVLEEKFPAFLRDRSVVCSVGITTYPEDQRRRPHWPEAAYAHLRPQEENTPPPPGARVR